MLAWDSGCGADNLLAGYRLARTVNLTDAAEWIEANYADIDYRSMPSKDVAYNGFWAVLALMTSVFIAVLLYMSLIFSYTRQDPQELRRWWIPFGALTVFGAYITLCLGCFYFFKALEGVIAVRFPYFEEYSCFVAWNKNFAAVTWVLLSAISIHHFHTRIPELASTAIGFGYSLMTGSATDICAHHKKKQGPQRRRASTFEARKVPQIRHLMLSLLASSDEDMSHCAPLFEHHKITQEQLGSLTKLDLISMGLCVGDAMRVLELLNQQRKRQTRATRGRSLSPFKKETQNRRSEKDPPRSLSRGASVKGLFPGAGGTSPDRSTKTPLSRGASVKGLFPGADSSDGLQIEPTSVQSTNL